MFSPNRKRPELPEKEKKPIRPEAKKRFGAVLGMSVALLVIYYGAMAIKPELTVPVMLAYMVGFAGFLIAYLAYNRAFVNKDVTMDMLPLDWSEEKKRQFIDDTKAREEKSRWMLVFIISFVVVFMAEMLYLFVWDGWLSKMILGTTGA